MNQSERETMKKNDEKKTQHETQNERKKNDFPTEKKKFQKKKNSTNFYIRF
jgi:hypothetical protein